jgi:hypothetical protein
MHLNQWKTHGTHLVSAELTENHLVTELHTPLNTLPNQNLERRQLMWRAKVLEAVVKSCAHTAYLNTASLAIEGRFFWSLDIAATHPRVACILHPALTRAFLNHPHRHQPPTRSPREQVVYFKKTQRLNSFFLASICTAFSLATRGSKQV